MAATFAVKSFPISDQSRAGVGLGVGAGMVPETDSGPGMGMGTGIGPQFGGGLGPGHTGPTMEIESKIEMAGRVRVLHFFTHHVEARAGCKVNIAVSDGSVLGFNC